MPDHGPEPHHARSCHVVVVGRSPEKMQQALQVLKSRSSARSVGRLRVGPRVHPACFLGFELSDGLNHGGRTGCGNRAYGSAPVG